MNWAPLLYQIGSNSKKINISFLPHENWNAWHHLCVWTSLVILPTEDSIFSVAYVCSAVAADLCTCILISWCLKNHNPLARDILCHSSNKKISCYKTTELDTSIQLNPTSCETYIECTYLSSCEKYLLTTKVRWKFCFGESNLIGQKDCQALKGSHHSKSQNLSQILLTYTSKWPNSLLEILYLLHFHMNTTFFSI